MSSRILAVIAALILCCGGAAYGQGGEITDDDAVFLVANPAFRDPSWFHTVLIAAPMPNGEHIGVILNRPTPKSLISFFPEHEPSKKVEDPVRYGGPFSPEAVVALVKADTSPGAGTIPLMKNLFMAFRAATIDKVIEETPNDARYFIGFVGWRRGELKGEIDRGLWAVVQGNRDTVFQKDTSELWEDMIAQSRRIRAEGPDAPLNLLKTSLLRSSSPP
jgi:putative transcriptional regulator